LHPVEEVMHPFDFATQEIRMLWASAALGLVQLMIAFLFSIGARGMPWALGARDESGAAVGKVGARLERAYRNYLETFTIFAALVLIANGMDRHTAATTVWGAQLYFYGRVLYVPLYAIGIPLVRSLAFTAAMAGIVVILLGIWPAT
jgi:uncharacterized MAPEG superfamily protein